MEDEVTMVGEEVIVDVGAVASDVTTIDMSTIDLMKNTRKDQKVMSKKVMREKKQYQLEAVGDIGK